MSNRYKIQTSYKETIAHTRLHGQWIVTRARLGNLGQVTRYVLVTGYNFIHRVKPKALVKNQNQMKSRFSTFVGVSLRAASILKNLNFPFC